jgi:hypothetical protein
VQAQLREQLQAQPVFLRQKEILEKLNLTADVPTVKEAKEAKNLDITQPLEAPTDKTEKRLIKPLTRPVTRPVIRLTRRISSGERMSNGPPKSQEGPPESF